MCELSLQMLKADMALPYRPALSGLLPAYQIYLTHADDGHGMDTLTGKPLKSFDEWLED